jgi:transposase
MLADETDFVIGGDGHLDTHELAVVHSLTAGVVVQRAISADRAGYRAALAWGRRHAPGRRAWALEGTGSYTAGLTRFLQAHGERVIEVDRPARNDTSGHRKSDPLDAVRAARTALGRQGPAIQPRQGEQREALRVLLLTRRGAVDARRVALNQLRAVIVTAPDELRSQLRSLTRARLLARCQRLRTTASDRPARRAAVLALRTCAHRILTLTAEIQLLERELTAQLQALAPQLLAEYGVGPISAAQLLVAWSHPRRFPTEGHFARLAGTAPIPASSGKRPHLRLDPRGDRQLNRALHTIVIVRLANHPPSIAYLARRRRDGKTQRDAIRCLKRYLARHLWRQLEHPPSTTVGPCH